MRCDISVNVTVKVQYYPKGLLDKNPSWRHSPHNEASSGMEAF